MPDTNLGRVLAVWVERPGRASLIAKNGWLCAHEGCAETPTCEVLFTRACRGGSTTGSHGTCEAHAEIHAQTMRGTDA